LPAIPTIGQGCDLKNFYPRQRKLRNSCDQFGRVTVSDREILDLI
jgi:hypothetical protein